MSGTNRVGARLLVSGRVQGVFYRAFTEETARQYGLAGWVRNLADGRVEARLEGPRPAIDRALARLRQGPPASRVDGIEVQWQEPAGADDFTIRYS